MNTWLHHSEFWQPHQQSRHNRSTYFLGLLKLNKIISIKHLAQHLACHAYNNWQLVSLLSHLGKTKEFSLKIKSLINTSVPRHGEKDWIIHQAVDTTEISERSGNFHTLLLCSSQTMFEKGSFEPNQMTYLFVYSLETPFSRNDWK